MNMIPEYALNMAQLDSGELVNALAGLSEITVAGRPKFGSRACRQVAIAICCRNYARAVHELCHMVIFAEAASGGCGWEEIFWNGGPSTAANFRSIAEPQGFRRNFRLTRQAVEILYADGKFSVSFSRMPFLSAMLEFLVPALGYGIMDDLFGAMIENGSSSAQVSKTAKALSQVLYAYLSDHLPSAQAQRNYRRLVSFLAARDGKSAGIDGIDDDAVLDFWRLHSHPAKAEQGDFKTFRSVFRSFVRLHQALDAAQVRNALNRPRTIGTNRADGEIDPDQLFGIVEAIDEQRNALEALRDEAVKPIKFFNGREVGEMELLFDCGPVALILPLSLMRAEIFGGEQTRITQALRRDAGETVRAVIRAPGTLTYAQRRQAFQNMGAHLFRVLLASLHALAQARNQTAISMVLSLRPNADFGQLARLFPDHGNEDGNVVVLDSNLIRDRFFSMLVGLEDGHTDLGALLRDARSAFGKLSRRGFRPQDLDDPDMIEGFAIAADPLFEINDHLANFCVRLDRMRLPCGNWSDQFDADRALFKSQFELLYGERQ